MEVRGEDHFIFPQNRAEKVFSSMRSTLISKTEFKSNSKSEKIEKKCITERVFEETGKNTFLEGITLLYPKKMLK